jgi:hypothetical protein
MIDLYQSINRKGIGQLEKDGTVERKTMPRDDSQEAATKLRTSQEEHGAPIWPLPKPDYHHIGECVVLKVSVGKFDTAVEGISPPIELRAVQIPDDKLAGLIFCGTQVHSRIYYTKRIRMLLEGKFNGADGWDGRE